MLAGAARAVRGEDGGQWAVLLRSAADRIATTDVYVRWQPGTIEPAWMRTAREELLGVVEEHGERHERTRRATDVGPIGLDEATADAAIEDQAAPR